MNDKKDNNNKRFTTILLVLYLVLTIGVGTAIIANIISIQGVHGDDWRKRGEERITDVRTDPARRGNIYSSDGKVLATTVTECDLYLDLYDTLMYDKQGNLMRNRKGVPQETGPIVDSNFTKYLDTVCEILHLAIPEHSVEYYRTLIVSERQKPNAKRRRCMLVQRGLPYSAWDDIRRVPGWKNGVVKSVDYKPVEHQVRAFIYGNMARNVIGFRNDLRDGTYTGLEGYYDSILRGQDGTYLYRRLTMGMWLPDDPSLGTRRTDTPADTVVTKVRVDGCDIVSTIDTRYQDIAENSLRRALHQYGGTSGCAILMEVETGYVLACANLSVDTSMHEYREVRDRNVSVSDVYEPGSTFKTVVLTAMLSDPSINLDTAMRVRAAEKDFGGKDGFIHDDHYVKDSEGRRRDTFSIREVIEQSSNVGMSELGWIYYRPNRRRDTLAMLVRNVFPTEKLHPDLRTPEYGTRINDLKVSNRDFLTFCFGHSTTVTPLQLITFYNALAGNGRMMKPLFCRALIDKDGRRTEIRPVVMEQDGISPQTAKKVCDMLYGVVNNGGTGKALKSDIYGIAGKTGTAEIKGRGINNSSFAGFFPAENPKYSCVVLLERCHAYGWQAGLVFKDIADCVVAIDKDLSEGKVKTVRPRLQEDSAMAMTRPKLTRANQKELMDLYHRLKMPYLSTDSASAWVSFREATDSTEARYIPFAPTAGIVPNCFGMTAKDAVAILHSVGYRVRVKGYGKVCAQNPRPGQAAKTGATIEVTLK